MEFKTALIQEYEKPSILKENIIQLKKKREELATMTGNVKHAKTRVQIETAITGITSAISAEAADKAQSFLYELEYSLKQAYKTNSDQLYNIVAMHLIDNESLRLSLLSLKQQELQQLAERLNTAIQPFLTLNAQFKEDFKDEIKKTLQQSIVDIKTPTRR